MNTTPILKLTLVLMIGVLGTTTVLGQRTFPAADDSPFKEDAPAAQAEEEDADAGTARSRARARALNNRPNRGDAAETTVRPRSRQFADDRATERPDESLDEDESSQKIVLHDQFAGWQEASDGLGDRRIGELIRANWVMVGPTGVLEGTVRPIDQAEVAGMTVYLMNKGRLVKTSAVQEDGSFRFNNVRRGAYSLIGWGDNAFFAFGANVLSYNRNADESVPTYITTYAFQNTTTINTDWIGYFTPNVRYRVYGRHRFDESQDDPAHLYGVKGLSGYAPEAIASTSVGATPVALTSDGRLIGRVHQMRSMDGRPVDVRSTKVMLLKADSVVASTTTDNYGMFEFKQVPAGTYGLLAAGVDGVGLTGLEAVNADSVQMNEDGQLEDRITGGEPFDFCLTSAEVSGWLNHFATEVSYQRSILAPRPPEPPKIEFGTGEIPNGNMANQAPPRCHSRDLTFSEWQQLGCGCYTPDRRDFANGVSQLTRRLDNVFERTFYPQSQSNGISGGNYSGAPNSNYPGYAPYGAPVPVGAPMTIYADQ